MRTRQQLTNYSYKHFLLSGMLLGMTYLVTAQTPTTAVNDTINMCEGTSETINVILNDIDPDAGEDLEMDVIIGPASALIDYYDEDSTITVIVDPAFTGNDVIVYQVCGNDDLCDIGLLYINVAGAAGCVWPGDANVDSICNYLDLLPIGIFYGVTGPIRYDDDGTWEESFCDEWYDDDAYVISPNPKFADCNGDGNIDAYDTLVIVNNYGQSHGTFVPAGFAGGPDDPLFGVDFFTDTVAAGSDVVIPLLLGSEDIPASNIYGLAFELDYDETLIVPSSIRVTFNSGWLGTPGTDLLWLNSNDTTNGVLSVSVTRNNQITRSGFGSIGEVSFVMEDNIAGKVTNGIASTVQFCIDYPQTRNNFGNPILINPVCDSIVVYQFSNSIDQYIQNHINIFPNPANDFITVNIPEPLSGVCRITDLLGQTVIEKEISATNQIDLPTDKIAAGTYTFFMQTDNAIYTHQLIIQH